MDIKSFTKDAYKISRIATVIIFLALIRTICEPVRLQYYSSITLTYEKIEPFLIGGLVAAVGLLIMTILSFYNRYKTIIAVGILIIILLLVLKMIYLL